MTDTTSHRGAERPLWEQVSDRLHVDIEQGAPERGARLPSEAELSRRYDVSRVTLRMALAHLEKRGVVHPQAGRGWFVGRVQDRERPSDERPVSEEPGMLQSFTEMARSRGLTAGAVVLHCRRRPAELDEAEDLGIAPGAPVLSLRRLRQLDGIAVAVDHSLVPSAFLPDVDAEDFRDASLYSALRRHGVNPYRADYEVQAIAADAEDARLLGVEPGAPLLSARQVCLDDRGRRIERGHITYRGDRYRFRAVLQV
jgi:DNA-binding GntR family transcriptional regulator